MQEKIVNIFDDMLYCLEKGLLSSRATRFERKLFKGWATAADAFVEMATGKEKRQRWQERQMPRGIDEVNHRMRHLGIEGAQMMYNMVWSSNIGPLWAKAALLAFLSWWLPSVK